MIEFYRGFGIGDVREAISDRQVREPQELFLDRVHSLEELFLVDTIPERIALQRIGQRLLRDPIGLVLVRESKLGERVIHFPFSFFPSCLLYTSRCV